MLLGALWRALLCRIGLHDRWQRDGWLAFPGERARHFVRVDFCRRCTFKRSHRLQ